MSAQNSYIKCRGKYEACPEKIFEQDENVFYNTDNSVISKFYAGKYVFLTGGTGFLGKLVMEKLCRACPDIEGIFMLVRAKKGKDLHTRIEEVFNDVLYEKLSKMQPKFRHKITPIDGDMSLPGLGISLDDRRLIAEKVHAIFHIAATVRFDEKLNTAVNINVKGTKEVLLLAKECGQLQTIVHVSTAFANCHHQLIEEKFYEPEISTDGIIQICDSTSEETLEKITPGLLGKLPNTYAFTKAIAEDTVMRYGSELPICIFRPAIVVPTYKEPLRSWIDNIYGPTGVVVGAGTGVLRVLHCDGRKAADIVPADMVVNAMIVASHKTAVERKSEIPVYNYVSSTEKPITWETYMQLNRTYGMSVPTVQCLWYYSFTLVRSIYLYYIYVLFLHLLPALLVDTVAILIRKKPQLLKVYKKIHKFSAVITYFSMKTWTFKNDNVQNLWKGLSTDDRTLFFFDMSQLDWEEYSVTHCMGLRTYLVKDDPSTLPEARKKWERLRKLHRAIQVVACLVALRLLYGLLACVLF